MVAIAVRIVPHSSKVSGMPRGLGYFFGIKRAPFLLLGNFIRNLGLYKRAHWEA